MQFQMENSDLTVLASDGANGVPPWHLTSQIQLLRIQDHEWSWIDSGGNGTPLILLPGALGTCEVFYKQLSGMGRDIRIIAITYPGISEPERLADGLGKLMDHLKLPKAHVLGSSYGGYWAQFFAVSHADRLETLTIGNSFVEPSGLFANPLFNPEWVLKSAAEELQLAWKQAVAKAPPSELRSLQLDMLSGRHSAENFKGRVVGVVTAKPCPELNLPLSKLTVLDCDDDPLVGPSMREAVRVRYAGATLRTLQVGGHYPHILNPTVYGETLRSMYL
jgi:pimeloyl-ACP methyl ester carboxylesterase